MSYPPYSGNATCVKCGHPTGTRTEYRSYGQCVHEDPTIRSVGWAPNERLHRSCRTCQYEWDEAIKGSQ